MLLIFKQDVSQTKDRIWVNPLSVKLTSRSTIYAVQERKTAIEYVYDKQLHYHHQECHTDVRQARKGSRYQPTKNPDQGYHDVLSCPLPSCLPILAKQDQSQGPPGH